VTWAAANGWIFRGYNYNDEADHLRQIKEVCSNQSTGYFRLLMPWQPSFFDGTQSPGEIYD